MRSFFFSALILIVSLSMSKTVLPQNTSWETLSEGVDLGLFKIDRYTPVGDSVMTVVRLDPSLYQVELLSAGNSVTKQGQSAKQWCVNHKLIAAINAGMFATDHLTHVGYLRIGDYVNSPRIIESDYRSAAAFDPVDRNLPPFRIFDLDETHMDSILGSYRTVVQNIRLIKRPRENRWSEKPKKWSEAALGEDGQGRMLLIFSRSPYTMHEFNEILLSLPIDLVCVQHLEGGPEAQLYLRLGDQELDLVGSFETDFMESDDNQSGWPIPNVIGIREKHLTKTSER